MKVQNTSVERLIPYAKNSRVHSDEQVAQIAASIKEFGWTNPILVDGDNGIIAGHGRLAAARKLGMTEVPVIELSHLSETQKKALIIADNKIALNASWDDQLLAIELEELQLEGFDLELIGFEEKEIKSYEDKDEQNDSKYTDKVSAPVYTPEGPKPPIHDLYKKDKALELISSIEAAVIPEDERQFLLDAATRHFQFDFQQIAEYYAHSSPATQRLMEDSALVIIDFDKAIENGFAKLSQSLSEIYTRETDEE
jgi:hypothetical protein